MEPQFINKRDSMTTTPELSGDRIQFLIETLNTTCEFLGFWESPHRAKGFWSLLEKERVLQLAISKRSFKLEQVFFIHSQVQKLPPKGDNVEIIL